MRISAAFYSQDQARKELKVGTWFWATLLRKKIIRCHVVPFREDVRKFRVGRDKFEKGLKVGQWGYLRRDNPYYPHMNEGGLHRQEYWCGVFQWKRDSRRPGGFTPGESQYWVIVRSNEPEKAYVYADDLCSLLNSGYYPKQKQFYKHNVWQLQKEREEGRRRLQEHVEVQADEEDMNLVNLVEESKGI